MLFRSPTGAPALQSGALQSILLFQFVFALAEDFFGGVLDLGEDVVASRMCAAVVSVMVVRGMMRSGGVM